jgi:prophage tail gpP-like protein
MPKPTEICTVSVGSEKYSNWKTVELTRSFDDPIASHCMLTVAEPSSNATSLSNIKLKPFDKVTVNLAGRYAMSGFVYLRQAFVDANQHGVQIGIVSETQKIIASTVDAKPGQYKDKTLLEICNAIASPVGVKITMSGNPEGADVKFKRFNEHMGERRIDAITRACQMRNMHLLDGHQGGEIEVFRGAGQDSGATIADGDYLRGRILLQVWDHADKIETVGQDSGNDSGDANRSTHGEANIPGPKRPVKYPAPQSGTDQEMQMISNHEKDWINFKMIDGDMAMQGWLAPDGSLWLEHVKQLITIKSPLLLPGNTMRFMIKGVVHRQSESGTTTDILLCDTLGVGAGGEEPVWTGAPT